MGASLNQWMASISCVLSMTMFGTCFMWITPLMVKLTEPDSPLPMTTAQTAWLAAAIDVGLVAFTIPVGILADRYGRKTVLILTGPIVLLTWVLVIFTKNFIILYIMKVIQGCCLAVGYTIAPMYIAEVSEPHIRGRLCGQFQTFYFTGSLIAYCTGPFFSYNTYALILLFIPILFVACFFSMPESPYYLLMVNETDKAFNSLKWFRAKEDIEEEFTTLKESIQKDMKEKSKWKDLIATKNDRKALFVVCAVSVVRLLNGLLTVTVYVTETFSIETHDLPPYIMTIIFGIFIIISAFISSFLCDIVGRRLLLITSTIGSAIFCLLIAIYCYLDQYKVINLNGYSYINLFFVITFCVLANIGAGTIAQTIQAEYFPTRTRSKGAAVSLLISSIGLVINIQLYQVICDDIGVYLNYIIFAVISIIGTVIFYFALSETAGKTLDQLHK